MSAPPVALPRLLKRLPTMSPNANRRWTIVLASLLILGSAASLVMFGLHHAMRWTYVRPVYYAQQQGQDAYEVARTSAAAMAGDFMTLAVVHATCIVLLAAAIIVLAVRRAR